MKHYCGWMLKIAIVVLVGGLWVAMANNRTLEKDIWLAIEESRVTLALIGLLLLIPFWTAFEAKRQATQNKAKKKPSRFRLLNRARQAVRTARQRGRLAMWVGRWYLAVVLLLSGVILVQYSTIQIYEHQLIRQLGGSDNEAALEALEELRRRGTSTSGGSWLEDETLLGVDLTAANLAEAFFAGARLGSANFTEANLIRADFTEVNLSCGNLQRADLQETDFYRTYLREANLTQANLQRADLSRANLASADLTEANLQDANLTNTILIEANLTNTNLQGADLSVAVLPDSTRWDKTVDMARFTDPNHPDFWHPPSVVFCK